MLNIFFNYMLFILYVLLLPDNKLFCEPVVILRKRLCLPISCNKYMYHADDLGGI